MVALIRGVLTSAYANVINKYSNVLNWPAALKSKYNRIIESQIIANLQIEVGAASTSYGAELFYIGEIKNQTIRRGFYNVLHRLFAAENNTALDPIENANANSDSLENDPLNSKVRYTLLKVASALQNEGSHKQSAALLASLKASSVERASIENAAVKHKTKSRSTDIGNGHENIASTNHQPKSNELNAALWHRMLACVDAWAVEESLRQEVRPAGLAADIPHIASHREKRAKFTELFIAKKAANTVSASELPAAQLSKEKVSAHKLSADGKLAQLAANKLEHRNKLSAKKLAKKRRNRLRIEQPTPA